MAPELKVKRLVTKKTKVGSSVVSKPKKKTTRSKGNRVLLTGRIVSNEQTVQGLETLFQDELAVGDILEVEHPTTLMTEQRRVSDVISHRTLLINEPFSTDVITTTKAWLLKQEPDEALHEPSTKTVTLREKTGPWGYKLTTHKIDASKSATDALDERIKKVGRDKFC